MVLFGSRRTHKEGRPGKRNWNRLIHTSIEVMNVALAAIPLIHSYSSFRKKGWVDREETLASLVLRPNGRMNDDML
jgi:hypothetical protein